MRWQNGLEVRDESLCESHRSAAGERARARASLECVQQYFILIMLYIERSQVQRECVHDRRKGLGRNANRWCSRRRVEYDGNQVSTSNSNLEDGKIHCVLTQETEQIREQLWEQSTSGPCPSISFGGALWITRRRSQLESEPCEAVRNNPSRQHVPTMWRTERDARQGKELPDAGGQSFDRCWCVEGEHAISRRVQSSDGRIRKRNGSRRFHSLKLLRAMMDVFDSISESCLDAKVREQRGGRAAEVSIEMSQGGDRTMGSDNARNITNSNSLFDAKVFSSKRW